MDIKRMVLISWFFILSQSDGCGRDTVDELGPFDTLTQCEEIREDLRGWEQVSRCFERGN